MGGGKTIGWAGVAAGLGLIAVAALVGFDAARMQVPPSYAKVGPQIFPYAIALGLAICGLKLGYDAWRGAWLDSEEIEPAGWKAMAIPAVALLAQVYLFKPLGFVICASVVFLAVAYAFGSRRILRDGLIGVAVALAAYAAFTYGLGLSLPPGIFKGLV